MVLGKLPVPRRPTVEQEPIALAVGAGGGCLDIFTLINPFSPLRGGRVVRWFWVNFQCRVVGWLVILGLTAL